MISSVKCVCTESFLTSNTKEIAKKATLFQNLVNNALYDSKNRVSARDAVGFEVMQTADDWIVPSGWRDIETNSFTTQTPTPGAVGPKQEGGYYGDDANKGYVYSKNTYANGFTMEFEYEFVRNGEEGYLQPDCGHRPPGQGRVGQGDEVIDDNDERKVSFVGNSGIKLGGFGGANDITEVAILDVEKMVELAGGIDAFVDAIYLENGVWRVKIGDYSVENLAQLMNGIGYNQNLNNIVGSAGKTPQELFLENYTLFAGNGGKMKIEYNGDVLAVYVESDGSYIKYYEQSGVKIPDKRVYVQSHWGSGVKYSNISIS